MCVTTSNMRLSGSFGTGCSPQDLCGDVSMIEQTGNEYWSERLTDGANELAVSIQNSTQSKQLESTSDSAEDSMDDREQADAKRMETVLILCLSPSFKVPFPHASFLAYIFPSSVPLQIFHFMIASLKSGRSSVLLDIIIRLVYPILSLQVNQFGNFAVKG